MITDRLNNLPRSKNPNSRSDPRDYVKANSVLVLLKRHRDILTAQEYRTLKGLALHNDIEGAKKGLDTIIRRQYDARNR